MHMVSNRIFMHGLRIHARHGVDPQERLTGADFLVSIEADTDFTEAMRTDRLEGTVSYADLYRLVKEEMATPSQLLEHVAGRILQRLFGHFPSVSRIRLTLTKENPPIGADGGQTGITVEAER